MISSVERLHAQFARVMCGTTPARPWRLIRHAPVDLGRPAVYDDLLAVPDILVAGIVDGDLGRRPGLRRATLKRVRLRWLCSSRHSTSGGRRRMAGPSLPNRTPPRAPRRGADLAGWRRTRMPRLPETAFFAFAPDWVCECSRLLRSARPRAEGARVAPSTAYRLAWLVDPLERTLEALRLDDGGWDRLPLPAGRLLVRVEPFDEVPMTWRCYGETRVRALETGARARPGRTGARPLHLVNHHPPITPQPGNRPGRLRHAA